MLEPLLQFDHVTKEFDLQNNWFGKPSKRFRTVNEVTWQVEQGAALGVVESQVLISQQWLACQLA